MAKEKFSKNDEEKRIFPSKEGVILTEKEKKEEEKKHKEDPDWWREQE